MLVQAKKLINILILLLGLALVVRSILTLGGLSFNAGIVAGFAFIVYGIARLYYFRRSL